MPIKLKVQTEEDVRLDVNDTENSVRFGVGDNVNVVVPTAYPELQDLPQINGNTLIGNKTTADLGIEAGVSSWNGQTGDVTYTAPVTSVNRQTGDVTVSVPTKVSDLNNDSGFVTAAQAASVAPVQSVNGATGAVTVTVPTDTSDLTNNAGFVTSAEAAAAAPVQSVNGSTGAVTTPNDKVEQTETTTSGYSNWRAVMISYGSNATWNGSIATTTNLLRHFNNLRYQPSTGTLRTTTFQGNLTGTASGNLKSGDNVSTLNNDAGYLTLATLPIWDGGVE